MGNTKRSLDFWRVNCSKHLNKRYYVVKKKSHISYGCENLKHISLLKKYNEKNIIPSCSAPVVFLLHFSLFLLKSPIHQFRGLCLYHIHLLFPDEYKNNHCVFFNFNTFPLPNFWKKYHFWFDCLVSWILIVPNDN